MQHWSSYWREQQKRRQATPAYGKVLERHWRALFEACGRRAELLDVGTGNGDVAILMARHAVSENLEWRVTGVDLAEIHPPENLLPDVREHLHFVGETALEKLPFEDGRFDLVTSQFAVEYADLEAALQECLRVLASGGRLAVVAHCAGSGLVRGSQATLEVLDPALDEDGLVDRALALVRKVQPVLSTGGVEALGEDAEANRLRAAYNEAVGRIQQAVGSRAVLPLAESLLGEVSSLVQSCGQTALPAIEQEINRLRRYYEDSRQRAVDQLGAAQSGERVPAVLERLGATPVVEDLYFGKDLIGRSILAESAAR